MQIVLAEESANYYNDGAESTDTSEQIFFGKVSGLMFANMTKDFQNLKSVLSLTKPTIRGMGDSNILAVVNRDQTHYYF